MHTGGAGCSHRSQPRPARIGAGGAAADAVSSAAVHPPHPGHLDCCSGGATRGSGRVRASTPRSGMADDAPGAPVSVTLHQLLAAPDANATAEVNPILPPSSNVPAPSLVCRAPGLDLPSLTARVSADSGCERPQCLPVLLGGVVPAWSEPAAPACPLLGDARIACAFQQHCSGFTAADGMALSRFQSGQPIAAGSSNSHAAAFWQ